MINPIVVMKTGGWAVRSLKSIDQIVTDIILTDPMRKRLVSSVPKGITDAVYNVASQGEHLRKKGITPQESRELIRKVYLDNVLQGVPDSVIDSTSLRREITGRLNRFPRNASLSDSHKMGRAHYLLGEPFFCEHILAPIIQHLTQMNVQYVDPIGNIFGTGGEIGNGKNREKSYEQLARYTDADTFMILPGFVVDDGYGHPITIRRGGSDTVGAVWTAALKADRYENLTNNSIRVVDPAIVPDGEVIRFITYEEYGALSYRNFSVLDESVIAYLRPEMIPTHVINHDDPSDEGTWVLWTRKADERPVTGIANDSGYAKVNVYKPGVGRKPGYLAALTGIIAQYGISIEHAPSDRDVVSFIMKGSQFHDLGLNRMLREFKEDVGLRPANMDWEEGYSIIAIVGRDMREGTSERASGAFAREHINIEGQTQATSDTMIYFVKTESEPAGVLAQYNEFFGPNK